MHARPNISRSRYVFRLTIVFFGFYLLLFQPWKGVGYDDVYYYAHSSTILFDLDADFLNDLAASNNELHVIGAQVSRMTDTGHPQNLWAAGVGLQRAPILIPTRLALWAYGGMFGLDWTADRFAYPYRLAASWATVIYGYASMLLVFSLALRFAKPRVAFWTTLCVMFASPMLAYTFTYCAMSHTYSFFTVALLLWASFRHRRFNRPIDYFLLSVFLGLACLARWQNVLFGFVPLCLWLDSLWKNGRWNFKHLALLPAWGAVGFCCVFVLQMCFWRAQYGKWLTIPQGDDFITWTETNVIRVLFSGWNGLFYFSPILLIAFAGLLIPLAPRGSQTRWRHLALNVALIVPIGLMIYINSVAGDWYGGAAFGGRRFCSMLPLLVPALAVAFGWLDRLNRWPVAILGVVAIFLNLFLMIHFLRSNFDAYALHELAGLMAQDPGVALRSLPTIWRDSHILNQLILFDVRWNFALLALGGALLIFGSWMCARRFSPTKLYRGFAWSMIGLAVTIGVVALTRTARPVEDGLAFQRFLDQPSVETFAAISPDYPNARYQMLRAERLAGESDDPQAIRRATFESLLELSPDLARRWAERERMELTLDARDRARRRKVDRDLYGYLHEQIQKSRREGDEALLEWIELFCAIYPMHFNYYQERAEILRRLGRDEEAEAIAARDLRLRERRHQTYLAHREAIGVWRKHFFTIFFALNAKWLAEEHARRGNFDRAIETLSESLVDAEMSPFIQEMLDLMRLKSNAESIDFERYENLIQAGKADDETIALVARGYLARESYRDAARVLNHRFNPHSPIIRETVGTLARLTAGKPERVDAILALDPGPELRIQLAEQWNGRGDFESGLRSIGPVLEADAPAWAWFTAAFAQMRLDRDTAAIEQFRRAIELDPSLLSAYIYLAEIYRKTGRDHELETLLEAGLKRFPNDPTLSAMRRSAEID